MQGPGLLLMLIAIASAAVQPERKAETYRDERRAIQFQYPSQWIAGKCEQGDNCVALFRRKADVAKGDSLVEVRFLDIALDQAIDAAGFMKEDGRWIMPSRGADQKAVELVGSGWTGIEAGTSCGEFFGGEGSTAVLNAGNRSAIVELVCRTDAPHEEFSTLLYSFEFGERPVRPR